MSDTTPNAAEKPINDGGGTASGAPQPEQPPADGSVSTDTEEGSSD